MHETPETPARTLDLEHLVLAQGAHTGNDGAMCVMEAVAWLAGEPWTDRPACASPVIAAYCRILNDIDGEPGKTIRQRLVPYIPGLIGSYGTPDVEQRRGYLAADWAVRVCAPTALRAVGLADQANILENQTPITDHDTATAAAVAAARAAASAAEAAAAAEAEIIDSAFTLLDRMLEVQDA